MNPVLLEEAIETGSRKKGREPKAIIPCICTGCRQRWTRFVLWPRIWDPVLEDAAEALGSEYKGQKCGTFGKFGALIFNGTR